MLLRNLLDHIIEIWIPRAKSSRQPIAPSRRDLLAVRHHIELAMLTRRAERINAQPFLDQGHETRDLEPVVLSRRTMHDFNLHPSLQSA